MPSSNSDVSEVKLQTLSIINLTNFLFNISLPWQMLAGSLMCIIKYTEAVVLLSKCHLSFPLWNRSIILLYLLFSLLSLKYE